MSMQMVELLYAEPPQLDGAEIAARSEQLLESGIELRGTNPWLLVHEKHCWHFKEGEMPGKEGEMPGQTAILSTDKPPVPSDRLNEALQQSWDCPEADQLIEGCRSSKLVTEMMCAGLEPDVRLRLFHGVLQAVTELTAPRAMVFQHTQQVVDPEAYLRACGGEAIDRPGVLNVRFFNISNSETDDKIMDIRGLTELGLHDLQCHFRDLDPSQVAQVLYGAAAYIFANGAVIESGHTIEGVDAGSKWICQFEESLLEPKREILDLNPGPPHAAGNRHDQ